MRQRPRAEFLSRGLAGKALQFPLWNLAVAILSVLLVGCSNTPRQEIQGPALPGTPGAYITQFTLTQNPISENGKWVNGKVVGLDWANVATIPGLAYGTQSGGDGFNDSTALLSRAWGPDQKAQATVYSVNQTDNVFEEVELRLRSSLSAHQSTGYEINFRRSKTPNAYTQIVRWNGALGDFTLLSSHGGAQYGVANGDVVKATVMGNVITVYLNGAQVNQATDDTYTSGSPGMGF